MKKQPAPPCKNATFPSPGTPNYRQPNSGVQKCWSSERVPLPSNAHRRNLNTPLLSYNNNGRTLPSKWEDAERWIFSPLSGDGALRTSLAQQSQKRPKSKSGPLGPLGVAYYQMFSPAEATLEVMRSENRSLVASSPFLAGMVSAGGATVGYGSCEGSVASFSMGNEPCIARSISVHGCSELIGQSSLAVHHQDEECDTTRENNAANNISLVVSRRDMATQMSRDSNSTQSSQRCSPSFSEAILPFVKLHHATMRNMRVDERVKKNKVIKENLDRGSRNSDDWKRKAVDFQSTGGEATREASKSFSMIQREEARITTWENLQKAKAETAIRKLEMKLEKKRSSSIDKIMNKLRSAQKKAHDLRSSVLASQGPHQSAGRLGRALFFRRTRSFGSLSRCFTCPQSKQHPRPRPRSRP